MGKIITVEVSSKPKHKKSHSKRIIILVILFLILTAILVFVLINGLTGKNIFFKSTDNTVAIVKQPIATPVPVTPDPLIVAQQQRETDFAAMQQKVQQYLSDHKLYMLLDLQGDQNESWLVNADEKNNGLSSIKIYVMVTVYSQIDQGKLTMNSHVSRYGYSGKVQQALNDMIHESSNEATGALILGVGGVKTVNSTIAQYLGADMSFHLAHTPGYMEGGYNIVTMKEEVEMLSLLEQGKVLDADTSTDMLNLMYGTDDYYSLKTIPGITAIAQKIADSPDTQFGIVAKIDPDSGHSYTFALQIWRKDSKNISPNELKDIVALFQGYFGQAAD